MMEPARVVISDPLEVESELYALGLDRGELREVLDAAKWARGNSTEYDPPGYAGWNQYAIGTRSLRIVLMESRGWTKDDEGGLCRTISPDGTMAIVVSSGNRATGNPDAWPKTKNPKGRYSLKGLNINRSQLELFESHPDAARPWLWFLLVNVRHGEVFGELSLPIDVDGHGRASDWLKRIMIGPDSSDDGDGGRLRLDVDDDLDIDVVRRAG